MSKPYSVEGTKLLRHHIACGLLAGRSLRFEKIRESGEEVGLREYEVNFLRLVDRFTNGTAMEINESGTRVKVKPGVIVGGRFTHQCSLKRGIGYCMEPIMIMSPFAKKPVEITFLGVTNNQKDLGVDVLRTVTIPLLRRFGIEASIQIKKRGSEPLGGGEVVFSCQPIRKLESVDMLERGKIKRVRGVGFTCRTSPDLVNRAISTSKGLLLKLLPDIFIAADHFTGEEAGNSPGYGLTLVAESTSESSVGLSEELCCDQNAMDKRVTAEDIGLAAAKLLLDQVKKGGAVDSHHQPMLFILMAISPEAISRCRIGPITQAGESTLAICRDFFSVTFTTKVDNTYAFSPTSLYSCIGCALVNVSKKSA